MKPTRLLVLAAALLSASLAVSQTPDAPAAAPRPQQPRGPRPAPTNLKALPKNTTGDQVLVYMRQYTGDLGVECEFCHAQNPDTKRLDAASDANPVKESARYMITMTAELNEKWLADMPNRMGADPITCGTCHRGAKHPSVFVPTPRQQAPRPPAATPPPTH